jgi:carbonic anhydrase
MTSFPPRLIEGYQNFISGEFEQQKTRYGQLAEAGQKPEIMVIACCDSRAAPETVFDCEPGELFVVRNVANLVPPYRPDGEYHGTSAALEFAVQALRIRNIVVMGHGRCGGITAALDPAAEPLSPGDFIGKWVSLLGLATETVAGAANMTASERQTALERISIRNSIANLRTFPCISILQARGELLLHGAWFDISTGELWIMNEDDNFVRPKPEMRAGQGGSG